MHADAVVEREMRREGGIQWGSAPRGIVRLPHGNDIERDPFVRQPVREMQRAEYARGREGRKLERQKKYAHGRPLPAQLHRQIQGEFRRVRRIGEGVVPHAARSGPRDTARQLGPRH